MAKATKAEVGIATEGAWMFAVSANESLHSIPRRVIVGRKREGENVYRCKYSEKDFGSGFAWINGQFLFPTIGAAWDAIASRLDRSAEEMKSAADNARAAAARSRREPVAPPATTP